MFRITNNGDGLSLTFGNGITATILIQPNGLAQFAAMNDSGGELSFYPDPSGKSVNVVHNASPEQIASMLFNLV